MMERSTASALYVRGACVALAFSGVMMAGAKPPADTNDTLTNPAPATPTRGIAHTPTRTGSSGDEGTLAGGPVVLWNNGPIATGETQTCTVPGVRSTLQNTAPYCLNTLGFGLVASTVRLADDFTLTNCAQITEFEFYAYNTGATVANVTSAVVNLHSGLPQCPSSNIIATVNASVAASTMTVEFTDIYRATTTDCSRRIQRVRVNTSSFPALPAGTYWISWAATLSNAANPFCPPVTILGQQGKPGGNARQSTGNGGPFNLLADTGVVGCNPAPNPPPNTVGQDMPFILRGTVVPCSAPCPADITGGPGNTPDQVVNVADLLAVIGQWGPCPAPPATCPADITGGPGNTPDQVVNVADLLAVIGQWGACPTGGGPPTPPPPATGACCTGSSCSVISYGACLAAGGVYFGDGTTCASVSCAPPANDECAGAIPLAVGTTTVFTHTATSSTEVASCSAAGIGADVWFTVNLVAGATYTVSTLSTPTTCGSGGVADTVIVVYDVCGGTQTEIVCNDDFGGGTLSSVSFGSNDPTTYRIRIGTWTSTNPGGRIDVTLSVVNP